MKRFFPLFLLSIALWMDSPSILFGASLSPTEKLDALICIRNNPEIENTCKQMLASPSLNQKTFNRILIALAEIENEELLLNSWKRYCSLYPETCFENSDLLEKISWSIIGKASKNPSPVLRQISTLAAVIGNDAKGVEILQSRIQDPNAAVRATALKLAGHLHDERIGEQVLYSIQKEKSLLVRIAAICAAGSMCLKEAKGPLLNVLSDRHGALQEKIAAVAALVEIFNTIEEDQIERFANSSQTGLRLLACALLHHFPEKGNLDIALKLSRDSHADVRQKALYVLGIHHAKAPESLTAAKSCLNDLNSKVAITACWLLTLTSPQEGQSCFSEWLQDTNPDSRRLAAAALGATGKYGKALARKAFWNSNDPYVKLNLATSLIGQRIDVYDICDQLYHIHQSQREKWMVDEETLFKVVQPSTVRHDELIPNLPEAINQSTRLDFLNILAMMEYPKTADALKQFLSERNWGISGLAAELLLTEGDESAIEIVTALLNNPSAKIQLQAALLLAFWNQDPLSVKVLQERYPSSDFNTKMQILEALGRLGEKKTLPFLNDRLYEPSQTLRVVAAVALLLHIYH